MIKRKGKFLTFCFSLIPGAGHMYLGFMKQGLSLMIVFWITVFLSIYMNAGALTLFLPIMFCYSFFDTINKNSLSDEDFYALEDTYLFNLNPDEFKWLTNGKFRPVIAFILIIIGAQMLLTNCYDLLLMILPEALSNFLYNTLGYLLRRLPQLLISLCIIGVGIHLIKGKKESLELEEQEADKNENP